MADRTPTATDTDAVPDPDPFDIIFAELAMWPVPTQQLTNDIVAALDAAGFDIVARTDRAPHGVSCLLWTDEWRPTAPTSLSAREAAVWMLADMDWATVLDELPGADEMDPLIHYGLRSELYDADWLRDMRFPGRMRSHLTAWVASRLVVRSWCRAEGHADDMIPFDECWHGDEPGSPCQWEQCWVLDGEPEDFLTLAATLIRDGWEPVDDPGADVARTDPAVCPTCGSENPGAHAVIGFDATGAITCRNPFHSPGADQ